MNSDWITIKEAAKILGIADNTVRGWVRRGVLAHRKWGGEYRMSRKDVEAYRDRGITRALAKR